MEEPEKLVEIFHKIALKNPLKELGSNRKILAK